MKRYEQIKTEEIRSEADLFARLKAEGYELPDPDELYAEDYILSNILPYAIPQDEDDKGRLTIEDPSLLGIKFGFHIPLGTAPDGSHDVFGKLKQNAPEKLGIKLIDILQAAERNIAPEIIPYEDCFPPDLAKAHKEWEESGIPPYMCVASANGRFQGAGALLSPRLPEVIKEKLLTDRFYILPSSIHEIIAVPGNCFDAPQDVEFLLAATRGINDFVTKPDNEDDFLSNNVYYYNGERFSTILPIQDPDAEGRI